MRDPNVPESLEGWWVLHRTFAFDRRTWDALPEKRRGKYGSHASDLFEHLQSGKDGDLALAQLVGHSADVMLTHYARTLEGLAYAQTLVDKLEVRDFLRPVDSLVSVVELALYDATRRIHEELGARRMQPHSAEWLAAFEERLRKHAQDPAAGARLWAKIPRRRYVCVYTMNKRRSGADNWYMLSYDERAALTEGIARVMNAYDGAISHVVSAGVGVDRFEWAVDLYADDPLVFKKAMNEARFAEGAARFEEFDAAMTGVQFSARELRVFLDGDAVPSHESHS